MRPTEAERLLQALRAGHIKAAELSGEQYQSIIFHKLIEHCAKHKGFKYEFLDNYQGAVDFVIREKPSRRSHLYTEDPVHVFECKHYSRTLELSTVAKLLVVGVRFQPTSLNVVSGTNLQPQVYDYARVFFAGLGNEAAMFRRTLFRHYRTGELLDLEVKVDGPTTQDKIEKSKAGDLSWVITELRPFSERVVAASSTRAATLSLDGTWTYRLDLSLLTKKAPKDFRIWVETFPSGLRLHPPKVESFEMGDGRYNLRYKQIIDSRLLKGRVEGYLAVHTAYLSRSHQVSTVPLNAEPSPTSEFRYPDLHQTETAEFVSMVREGNAPRLLLLGGQAGVGKTHLCEDIAGQLKLAGVFDIDRFSVNPETETTLLHTMLTTVCTPAAARSEHRDEWQELATSLLTALSPVHEEQRSSQSKSEPLELLIPVLAEILVRAGPRLIVLRDTHLMTEEIARGLRALFARLDDLGWGDLHCILEHRTPDGKNNPQWMSLESDVRTNVNRCLEWHLNALTRTELNDYLDSLFTHITLELKTAIWDTCGGVALYLFSLLDLLNSEGAIRSKGGHRWRIEAPSAFFRITLTKRRADGVLEERLRAVSWKGATLPSRFEKEPLALVALFAIAREPARVQRITELTEIGLDAYFSIRRTLLRHNVIRPTADNRAFEFQHELLCSAAVELGRDSDPAQEVVERILSTLGSDQQTVSDLEFCGDLAAWMGFPEDAARALNAAFERLRKTENFVLIRRILNKLCEYLKLTAFDSPKSYVEYLACQSALAWATWNAGSLMEARTQYSRIAADALASSNNLLDGNVAEASAADALRRVVGIDLELGNTAAFLKSTKATLELNAASIVFNSIVNRLVLYCAGFTHVELGLHLAQSSLQVFGDPEPESSGAVICSDIGALFRAAAPHSALALYYRGAELSNDPRQRIHNEMDVLITETMLGLRKPQTEELALWRQRLIDNGLRSMLVRFDLFCAALALQQGRIEQAERLYSHVETTIAVYKHEKQQIDVLNDRMVAVLLSGNQEAAHQMQNRIVSKLARSLEQRRESFEQLRSLLPAIQVQKNRFAGLTPLELDIPKSLPPYSGLLIHVLLNLENLSRVPGAVRKPTLRKATSIWPADLDHSHAMDAFLSQLGPNAPEYRGIKLGLCTQ
jgi:hypothetical protein